MLPEDVIKQSIIAIYQTSATTATGYAGNVAADRPLPGAGQRPRLRAVLCPAQCPGTAASTRDRHGAVYGKIDMSFVKRFALPKNMKIEARMDLFNVFNTINFDASNFAMGISHHELAGHGGGGGQQHLAGSGRPDHAVRPARHLVGLT